MHSYIIQNPNKPIEGEFFAPGSKSYTNRALIMATLTKGVVQILNPLLSDDTEAMIDCLNKLGVKTEKYKNKIIVFGDINDIKNYSYELNTNLSGTTIRFLLSLCSVCQGKQLLYGKESLNKRPIKDLVDGLRQIGAKIEYQEKEGYPPVIVESNKLNSGKMKMNGQISSQYFSSIFMISPIVGELNITVEGELISKTYADMTIDMMADWGINIENKDYKNFEIKAGQNYSMKTYKVEGDYSAVGYFVAISALTGSKIKINNLKKDSKQGDRTFLDIVENMGNKITWQGNSLIVEGHGGVKPVEVNMEPCPDQAQTLAVLCAFAKGKTTIKGVRSLRVKETERVKALQKELGKMGIKTESPDIDTLIVYGGDPKNAQIDTYHDHRMAMSFAVAGTKIDGLKINDPDVVKKTFPNFWEVLANLGFTIKT